MEAPNNIEFWNRAAATRQFTREPIPGATFLVNDGERLPCGDASVDAVLPFAALTCIPSDDTQKNLLREFKRILRPGGLLLMIDYPLQSIEIEGLTMNGNPTRLLQCWARNI